MKWLDKLNISLGKWFDVPVFLHWSWSIIFVYLLLAIGPMMAVTYAGVFFIVLLHEFGHCLAARHYGIFAQKIVLYPIGGAASIRVPPKPWTEFVVTVCGPLVNVALIPILFLTQDFHSVLGNLYWFNWVMLIFNLLPVFPMDGGRIFRSLLSMWSKDHYKSTLIAARTGQVCCFLMGIFGLYSGHYMLIFIAVFMFMAAEAELQAVTPGVNTTVTEDEIRNTASSLEEFQKRYARTMRDRDD